MNDFRKENDLDGSQGDLRALGHPQRPRQAQPRRVQQVPCSSKNDMTHVYILFFKEVDQEALGHPQRPRQAHP